MTSLRHEGKVFVEARLQESAYVGLGAFLVATLTFDPAVRLDSQDVLGHVWFVDSAIAP